MANDRQPTQNRPTDIGARLSARPAQPVEEAPRGRRMLGLDAPRDGLLYIPLRYRVDSPAPLAVLLHGAGGNARLGGSVLQFVTNRTGIIFLAPESRGRTWDVIRGSYGPDVAYIDRALALTFSRYAVDPARLAIGGFSDGASYALSLGIANGDLFTHIMAFSPGFMAPAPRHGQPRIFITHGTRDRVLPIDRCSRRIVPRLRRAGYDLRYREFNGPHIIPPHIAIEAVRWLATQHSSGQPP